MSPIFTESSLCSGCRQCLLIRIWSRRQECAFCLRGVDFLSSSLHHVPSSQRPAQRSTMCARVLLSHMHHFCFENTPSLHVHVPSGTDRCAFCWRGTDFLSSSLLLVVSSRRPRQELRLFFMKSSLARRIYDSPSP